MTNSTRRSCLCITFFTFNLFLSFFAFSQAPNKEKNLGSKIVTIERGNKTFNDVFKSITNQTGIRFSYNNNDFDENEIIGNQFIGWSVERVLKCMFASRFISWVYIENVVRIGKSDKEQPVCALGQFVESSKKLDTISKQNLSGVVVDDKGASIPGATVSIKGQNRGQGTDTDGKFFLDNVPPNSMLIISSIGYETRQVRIAGLSSYIKISLKPRITTIEPVEVVSTGYQNIPKERVTGSFVQISNQVFNEQVGTNVLERLPFIANSVNVIPSRLTANQFELTIRGISTIRGPKGPLIVVDNFPYEGDINNINPNDIENINILRDAAATSIWGTRAGNGVIIINTKKGKFNQKFRMEINSNLTFLEKPDLFYIKEISTNDFIDVEKFLFDKGYYDPLLPYYPSQTAVVDILEKERDGEISNIEAESQIAKLRGRDLRNEYEKYVYQTAINKQFSVNLRGGSNTIAWALSGGYDRNINEVNGEYNRYSFRLENTYKPIQSIQVTAGLTYSNSYNGSGKKGYKDIPNRVVAPYTLLKDESGYAVPFFTYRNKFLDTIGNGQLLDWKYYPLDDHNHNTSKTNIQNILARIGVKYSMLKWLSFDLNYQIEKQNSSTRKLADIESYYARDIINRFSTINYQDNTITQAIPEGGILDISQGDVLSQNFRGQMNIAYNSTNSSIIGIIGTELRDLKNETGNNRSYGYNSELLTTIPVKYTEQFPQIIELLGSSTIPYNSNFQNIRNRFVSFYSNFAYTLLEKYTLSLSGRRDASNLFGASINNKWTPLWSAGISWNISNEGFYKSQVVPNLKFRATYGFNGNVSPNLSSVSTIAYVSPSIYTSGLRAQISNFYNPDLSWEKVGMLNFGIDFSLKGETISGSIEYYKKNAKDLYGNTPYDRTLGLGVSTVQKNAGKLRGDGVDILLNTININRNLIWTTNFNFSYYNDKIIDYYMANETAGNYVGGESITKGFPRYPIFSYKTAGLDGERGDPQGYIDGKISTNYSALTNDSATIGDLNFHGTAIPKYYGSIGNNLSYKNFTISLRLLYQFGYYFRRNSIDYSTLIDLGVGHEDYSRRWQKPGDERITSVPSMGYPIDYAREAFYKFSEPLISKGDHIRLQYINIGYSFTKDLVKWSPFTTLRLYAVLNNIGIIWAANKHGIDPLYVDPQIPPSPNYSIGLNIVL